MDGSARLAALGTIPTDLSVQMDLHREVVGALLDAATDAAVGNGERDGHASQVGKLSLSRHRPESIGRHPRKVSKSHKTGVIPVCEECTLRPRQCTRKIRSRTICSTKGCQQSRGERNHVLLLEGERYGSRLPFVARCN